ncbi:hypothetical protein [Streptomyces sp. NPDC003032]
MESLRADRWIRKPKSADQLLEYLGKHMVAYPSGSDNELDKAGGQFIALDPEARTVSLRRYDDGAVREFPWGTTDLRYTTDIESPFVKLPVGAVRRFEWFWGDDDRALEEPVTLVGTVDAVTPGMAHLWVRDHRFEYGGWWASLKHEDAAKHALRPVNLKQGRE